MLAERKAAEVFVNKKEPKELRIAQLHRYEPRCHHQQKYRYAPAPVQAPEQFPVALD